MTADYLLVAGGCFVLILAIGQLLISRKHSTNRILSSLFVVSFLWIAHAIAYRFGMVERLPHLNKVYLPLLCITGSMWYTYVRCVYEACPEGYNRRYFLLPIACIVLSLPFYLQSAEHKRNYIEVELVDFTAVTMYAASRLAELTLVWYFCKSLVFLRSLPAPGKSKARIGISRVLWYLTIAALCASLVRMGGSIAGSDTISVLYPCLVAIGVFVIMHFLSYRQPVILSLSHATRSIQPIPAGALELEQLQEKIRAEQLYLDSNLKVQALARKVGIPTATLSSLINTVTGKNFNEFISAFRVEHAKSLLLSQPQATILDIAQDSGFNSKSAFYKHFSSVTGMTPVQYRAHSVSGPAPEQRNAGPLIRE